MKLHVVRVAPMSVQFSVPLSLKTAALRPTEALA